MRIKLSKSTNRATVMSHPSAKKVVKPKAASTHSGLRERGVGKKSSKPVASDSEAYKHTFSPSPGTPTICRHRGAAGKECGKTKNGTLYTGGPKVHR